MFRVGGGDVWLDGCVCCLYDGIISLDLMTVADAVECPSYHIFFLGVQAGKQI